MSKCTCDEFCDSPCPEHATDEEKAAWDGGLGDLGEDLQHYAEAAKDAPVVWTAPEVSPEEELLNDRLKLWHSTTDARAVQVALMLTADEYAAFVERNEIPAGYLERKRPDDYSKVPGIGQLQGGLVPDLDKPLTFESLVEQYEARAREVHKQLGWFEDCWRGLAALWAVTDLEIMRITRAQAKGEPEDAVLRRLFRIAPRKELEDGKR